MKKIIATKLQDTVDVEDLEPLRKKIAQKTKGNDTNGGAAILAEFLKNRKYIDIVKAITVIADIEGSMPSGLISYRNYILTQMSKDIEHKYGKEAKELIYGAF